MRISTIAKSAIILLFILFGLATIGVMAQVPQIKFNAYGHQEYTLETGKDPNSYFSLGEHAFFLTTNITDRIYYLGEYAVRTNSSSSTGYLPSIERSLIRFNYSQHHSVIAGKVHTPLNYWNDVYHHGRLFFPVIDRPFMFSHYIPLHTLGVQLQGQNIGGLKFGYDAMIGNGINSTDAKAVSIDPSITVSLHIKPTEQIRIGGSFYYDYLENNGYGSHSGHTVSPSVTKDLYEGPLHFALTTASLAYFGEKFEILQEFAFNRSKTDSLGISKNISYFSYVAHRFSDKHVLYGLYDSIGAAENDLHVYPLDRHKLALGYRLEVSPNINLKMQLEQFWDDRSMSSMDGHDHMGHMNDVVTTTKKRSIRIQIAYGF
jgi:hypothetical protein